MWAPNRASTLDPTPDSVVQWRTKRLRAAGLDEELAHSIAVDCRYDLHALLELVDRGCPGDVATRILAPLDDRDPRC